MSSSKPVTQSVPPPLPTPTSATHPPNIHTGASSNSINEAHANRVSSPATSLPPFTPPSMNGMPTLSSTNNLNLPFSPNFTFSPLPQIPSLAPTPTPGKTQPHQPPPHQPQDNNNSSAFDPMLSMPTPYDQQPTPSTASASGGSVHTAESDRDPFLSLLEQLAENEASQGGPSELDFFLSGQSG